MEQTTKQEFKSFSQIEEFITSSFKSYNIDSYDLSDLLKKIRRKLIEDFITKYNVYQIQNHKLRDNRDLYNLDKFKDIEQFIKSEFSKYNKSDRVKELLFKADVLKMLNKDKRRFYSWSDLVKDYTKEEFIKELSLKCSKEILFSCWALNDKYRRFSYLKQLRDLLKVVFNIELSIIDNAEDLKNVEEAINKQNLGFKVRFFSEWFYLGFTDKTKHDQLLKLVLEQELQTYDNMKSR